MLRESQNIASTEHCLPSWVHHWNAPVSSPQSPSPYELPRSIETEPPRLQIDLSGSQLIFKSGHLGRIQVGKILSFLKSSNASIESEWRNYTSTFSLGNLSQDIGERLLKQGKHEFWRNTYSMVWEAWIAFNGLESNDKLPSGA